MSLTLQRSIPYLHRTDSRQKHHLAQSLGEGWLLISTCERRARVAQDASAPSHCLGSFRAHCFPALPMSAQSERVQKAGAHPLRRLMEPHPHCMNLVRTAVEETE